ncbi:MAG TPA: hypothetical protein VHI51_14335, partial [Ktedonobacterales bacterium]|nr:hypothetical protein [Ktedonobacterales bacterium]
LRLAAGLQAVARVVAALLVIASFIALALHFLHVEVSSAIPDVWPIFEPSGIPGLPSAWWRTRATS